MSDDTTVFRQYFEVFFLFLFGFLFCCRRKKYGTQHNPLDAMTRMANKETNIDSKYFIDYSRKIGSGTCTVVRKCIDRKTNKRYAVKTISKYRVKQVEMMKNEIELLQDLNEMNHPNILSLVDVFEDNDYLHLVTEYCKGGEIFKSVAKHNKKANPINEREAVSILQQLIKAVAFCHEKDIVHRDLKLENILFTTKQKDQIKLIDFDIASRHRKDEEPLSKKSGSMYYVAPEVLAENYDRRCDVWGIGVIAYVLLFGRFPFYGETSEVTLMKIRVQNLIFPAKNIASQEAKNFIISALQKEPAARASLKQLEQHPWMIQRCPEIIDDISTTFKKKKKLEGLSSLFLFFFGGKSNKEGSTFSDLSTHRSSTNSGKAEKSLPDQ
jgi:calcium-dependent protein kinase